MGARHVPFRCYKPLDYTQKWNIPKEANKNLDCVPVNPNAFKYATPADLGDALRQF